MFSLLWFSGIGGDTKIREIGWTWVLLVVLICVVIYETIQFIKLWNEGH